MNITLPNDLESSVQAAVHSGRFASVDDAMAEAVRLLLRELNQGHPPGEPIANPIATGPGFIGALRADADLLDQAVEHAMKVREERPWRLSSVE